jgi:hypothetical protein
LCARKYEGEKRCAGSFPYMKKKKLGQPLKLNLGCQKKCMKSSQQHCLYLKDRIKNSNDSNAIQPHKNRIHTENDEKVYKVVYRLTE